MTADKARRKQIAARRHRRLGVFVSLWLAFLAISGVAINHAHGLGLDRRPVPAVFQRWMYGIETGTRHYCKTMSSIGPDCEAVFGDLPLAAGTLLLSDHSVFILDGQGQLVEKLGAGHFGLASIDAGLLRGSMIYLRDARQTVGTDLELLNWQALDGEATAALSASKWQVRGNRTGPISWERFMLDLHAARFLGPVAKWFNDLMAALILLLAISGIWLFRNKRNNNGA